MELLARVQRNIAEQPTWANASPAELARLIRQLDPVIADVELLRVMRAVRTGSQGLGVLEPLLREGVTDIVVNGDGSVFVDNGNGAGLTLAPLRFDDDEQVRALATRLALACGRRLDDAQPFADGRVTRPDGTGLRIHALLSPPASNGTCLSIRVLGQARSRLDELGLDAGDVTKLKDIVASRQSFVVVGGTGSGKTTLLSAMLAEVPHNERIVCIEDTPELNPQHPHLQSLVARQANVEGVGAIDMACLLQQALRMRPDWLVVGEIRGKEVVDLLAALNTGHAGAGTLHANSVNELPARIEALAALGGLNRDAAWSQLKAAVHCVIVMKRHKIHEIGGL